MSFIIEPNRSRRRCETKTKTFLKTKYFAVCRRTLNDRLSNTIESSLQMNEVIWLFFPNFYFIFAHRTVKGTWNIHKIFIDLNLNWIACYLMQNWILNQWLLPLSKRTWILNSGSKNEFKVQTNGFYSLRALKYSCIIFYYKRFKDPFERYGICDLNNFEFVNHVNIHFRNPHRIYVIWFSFWFPPRNTIATPLVSRNLSNASASNDK